MILLYSFLIIASFAAAMDFFEKYVQWMRNCCWRRFPPSRIEDISWSSTWLYASNLRCIPPGSTSSESLNFFCVWYSTLGFMYNIVFVILLLFFCFCFYLGKKLKITRSQLYHFCFIVVIFAVSYRKDIRRNNQFLPSMSQSNLFRLSILHNKLKKVWFLFSNFHETQCYIIRYQI